MEAFLMLSLFPLGPSSTGSTRKTLLAVLCAEGLHGVGELEDQE